MDTQKPGFPAKKAVPLLNVKVVEQPQNNLELGLHDPHIMVEDEALKLRIWVEHVENKKSLREIAAQENVNRERVRRLYHELCTELAEDFRQNNAQIIASRKAFILSRLDKLEGHFFNMALGIGDTKGDVEGQAGAALVLLKIQDQAAKLVGAYAPKTSIVEHGKLKVEPVTPEQHKNRLMKILKRREAQEKQASAVVIEQITPPDP